MDKLTQLDRKLDKLCQEALEAGILLMDLSDLLLKKGMLYHSKARIRLLILEKRAKEE